MKPSAALTLDSAGRVVLPKAARDALNLHAGSALRLDLEAGGLRLTPVEPGGRAQRKGRLLVWHGEAPITADDTRAALAASREDALGKHFSAPRR